MDAEHRDTLDPTSGDPSRQREGTTGGGWTSPPLLPATSPWHRRADRLLGGVRSIGNLGLLFVVVAAFLVANLVPDRIGIWVAVAAFLAIGLYCSVNFWRCREAHCVITGVGFTVLGVALLAEALGADNVIAEHNGPLALGVLLLAIAFEAGWRIRYGTNVVRSSSAGSDAC